MRYYIDCEFEGLDGQLLSMAIVSETGKSLYAVMNFTRVRDEWVRDHVLPHLYSVPTDLIDFLTFDCSKPNLSIMLERYFKGDMQPYVIADWPDDIKYLTELLITGPGTMIDVPGIRFAVKRVDAYPTDMVGAVQHNAWWDAIVLRDYFIKAAKEAFSRAEAKSDE